MRAAWCAKTCANCHPERSVRFARRSGHAVEGPLICSELQRAPLGVLTRSLREFPSRPMPAAGGMGFFDSTGSTLRALPFPLRMTALKEAPSNRRPHRLWHASIIPFQYAGMATLRVGVAKLRAPTFSHDTVDRIPSQAAAHLRQAWGSSAPPEARSACFRFRSECQHWKEARVIADENSSRSRNGVPSALILAGR
jgi:hypothetical protein